MFLCLQKKAEGCIGKSPKNETWLVKDPVSFSGLEAISFIHLPLLQGNFDTSSQLWIFVAPQRAGKTLLQKQPAKWH